MRASGNAGLMTSSGRRRRASSSAAASPHHHVGMHGSSSGLPSRRCRGRGQELRERGRLEHGHAERVRHEHVARAPGLHQAGHAERRVRAQLERIAEVVVQPPQDGVDALEAGQRLEIDAVLAHGEVAALDEGEAEVAGQVRVLEVRLVVRARRQQHDVGRLAVARRPLAERLLKRQEELGEPLHAELAEGVGEEPRDGEAVLERIARARRRLGARAGHPPSAVGPARQVEGDLMQVDPARRRDAVTGAQEAGMPVDQRRRDEPFFEQALRAIEIGGQRVQQARPLAQAPGNRLPLRGGHDVRQHVERPRPRGPAGVGVDVVGDAVLVKLARGRGLHGAERVRAEPRRVAGEAPPVRPHRAGAVHQLVEMAGGRGIRREDRVEAGSFRVDARPVRDGAPDGRIGSR